MIVKIRSLLKGSSKGLKSQKGISLVETIFSFSILAVSVLASIQLITKASQMSQDTQSKLLALGAARSVMEVLKTTPLSEVGNVGVSSYVPADLLNGSIAVTTDPSDVSSANIGTVTVTVSWTNSVNQTQTYDLTSMKSKYGRIL